MEVVEEEKVLMIIIEWKADLSPKHQLEIFLCPSLSPRSGSASMD
jgi:hypothetical protein